MKRRRILSLLDLYKHLSKYLQFEIFISLYSRWIFTASMEMYWKHKWVFQPEKSKLEWYQYSKFDLTKYLVCSSPGTAIKLRAILIFLIFAMDAYVISICFLSFILICLWASIDDWYLQKIDYILIRRVWCNSFFLLILLFLVCVMAEYQLTVNDYKKFEERL